jgi:uncharacterized protein YjeT (DUF2065 family)
MTHEILRALALVAVIEGILPFVAPSQFRAMLVRLAQLDDGRLRTLGVISMVIGLVGLQAMQWLL